MAERFAYSAGTISITSNSSTVIGTGTAFRGHDRAGSVIYALPAAVVPVVVGVVAEVTPRGIYDNLQLPLVAQYKGATLTNVPYVIVDGPAIANGATQAAIYARYAAFLEQSMGLVGDSADTVDLSIVPENSIFIDSVTKKIFQWRNGVLQELFGVAQGTSSFLAHKSVDQTGLASSSTVNLITFDVEDYDAGAFFASNRWTPPAGKVSLTGAAQLAGTWSVGTQANLCIYKNGSQFHTVTIWASAANVLQGLIKIDDACNGTDFYELKITIFASVGTYTVKNFDATYFCGHMLSQQGAAGTSGADGRDPGVLLTWDGATTDADPGTGELRADNVSLPSATQLFVSKTSRGGSALATFLNALDDSTNPSVKGTLVLTRTTDNVQATFNVTSVTDATNYVKVAVSGHSGATSFVAANPISFQFSRSGDQGGAGAAGAPGAVGPAAALEWLFSTTTTDADPGIGNVRFNNATFGSITQLFLDNAERGGTDVSTWLDTFDDSTNTSDRGIIVVIDVLDPTDFALFRVTGAVVDGTGYRKVPVTPLVQAGSFLTGERVSVLFARTGNQGTAGAAGAPGAAGADGRDPGVLLTWDTATTDADPGAGKIRGNNASLPSATQLFVSKTNRAGSDIAVFLNALDDSTNPVLKGTLVLTRATDDVQAIFSITGVTDATGYVKVAVSGHSGATSFAASNPISFQFSRAGNLGTTGSTGATGPGYLATSTTSFLIGTGSKAFTTQAGLAYTVGARARASSAANTANFMEGLVTAYSGTTLTINVTLIGGSGTAADWNINLSGEQGSTGVTGATGPTAVLEWLFDTTITDADPGSGTVRANNATFASITNLFFDNNERNGTDVSAWLNAFDDSTTGGNKGFLVAVKVTDTTKFAIFQVTGSVVDGTGYRKVPVTPIVHNGFPWTAADRISWAFARTGDLGATGSTGATGAGYAATSTTSLAVATGSKAFTTQAGLAYTVGARARASSAANTANFMEGLVTAYSGTTLTINVTLIGGSGTAADWNINLSGEQGVTGSTGAVGPTTELEWLFDTTITDADPGSGNLRFNNATFTSITNLFFDNNERNGAAVTAWLDSFDDSTTLASRGYLVLVKVLDPTKFAIFKITGAVVDGTGYRKVPVLPIQQSAAFSASDRVSVAFLRTGDAGAGAGDVVGPASSVDSEIALFNSTTGKLIKRATGTGYAKVSSGVLQTPAATIPNTDITGLGTMATQNASAVAITGGSITGLPAPSGANDAATKTYVDSLMINMGKRQRVRFASTANITLSAPGTTIDGVTAATGDLFLAKNQTAPAENGIYTFNGSASAATRTAEFDTYNEHPGSLVSVAEGTANADTLWLCTSNEGGTLGTTAIAFVKLVIAGELLAANNLSDVANTTTTKTNLGLVAIASSGSASDLSTGTVPAARMPALTGDVTTSAGSVATTIGNTVVTYAKMQNVSATSRFLGRITAGAGSTEELTGTQATTLLDAFTTALKGLAPASGGGTTNFLRADGTWAAPAGGGGSGMDTAGGRLSLSTGVPVMTSTVSAATTVYYTPYIHRFVPLFNGTSFTMTDIGGELSQATTDTTKSPAAVTTNSNYDVFVWNDGGTFRATRGPAWTSGTGRGTGAGTTELVRVQGILLNANAITNGPAAQRGTWAGTIRSNGSSQIDWILGGLAAGGTAAVLGVWNMYNRVDVEVSVQDSTDTWTYATATWRSSNNSAGMRVSFVQGLAEDSLSARYQQFSSCGVSNTSVAHSVSIGYDSTSAPASGATLAYVDMTSVLCSNATNNYTPLMTHLSHFAKNSDIGFHFVQALEWTAGIGETTTFYGDGATTTLQNGFYFRGRF